MSSNVFVVAHQRSRPTSCRVHRLAALVAARAGPPATAHEPLLAAVLRPLRVLT